MKKFEKNVYDVKKWSKEYKIGWIFMSLIVVRMIL